MAGLVDLCKRYFGQSNLYAVLGISKNATEQQVKKAYHKLSLKVHPDRVDESEKVEATEKFKVLGKIHTILSSKEKRAVYDETGGIDEEDCVGDFDWLNYWRAVFRPISKEDIINYEKNYKNSYEEAMDLKKAYLNGKGDMDFIHEVVPFMNCDEEPRIREIIQKFIDEGEVPEYDCFVNEPPRKAAKRRRKYALEAKKAESLAAAHDLEDATGEETLKLMIESRQRDRGEQMNNFFDQLAAKYGQAKKKKDAPKTAAGRKRKRN